jgi:hypothetical protein
VYDHGFDCIAHDVYTALEKLMLMICLSNDAEI